MKTSAIGIVALIAAVLVAGPASGDLIVDGGFDVGFVGTETLLSGEIPGIGGDGSPVGDGWVSHAGAWTVAGGRASRVGPAMRPEGFGQIVTNGPGYVGGDWLRLRFDYDILADSFDTFSVVVYGVYWDPYDKDFPDTEWHEGNGDAMRLDDLTINGTPGTGNYMFVEELKSTVATEPAWTADTPATGLYSKDFDLGYDYGVMSKYGWFVIGFTCDDEDGDGVFIDNVSLVQVPEPASMALLALGLGALAARRRKRA